MQMQRKFQYNDVLIIANNSQWDKFYTDFYVSSNSTAILVQTHSLIFFKGYLTLR